MDVSVTMVPRSGAIEGKGDKQQDLVFVVSDTGQGIPSEKQETIFNPFIQADASHTRQYGGTGLGLSITKNLVDLLGGTIYVSSEVGKGSKFTMPGIC